MELRTIKIYLSPELRAHLEDITYRTMAATLESLIEQAMQDPPPFTPTRGGPPTMVSLPASQVEWLEEQATARGANRSEIVRSIVAHSQAVPA